MAGALQGGIRQLLDEDDSIAVGLDHSCGLRASGHGECWGDAPALAEGRYTAIVAGAGTVCALDAAGGATCTGIDTPTGSYAALALAPGGTYGVALDAAGVATTWGSPDTAPPAAARFTTVGAGTVAACGIVTAGSLTCWGSNQDGELAAPAGSSYTGLAVGEFESCALGSTGTATCWGAWEADAWGGRDAVSTPAAPLSALSVGYAVACGIRASDGGLVCFGSDLNETGMITDAPAGAYVQVSVGEQHACAVDLDGAAVCWGVDDVGETVVP